MSELNKPSRKRKKAIKKNEKAAVKRTVNEFATGKIRTTQEFLEKAEVRKKYYNDLRMGRGGPGR